MPTVHSILENLKAKGSEKTRILFAKHGLPAERVYGVSMAELKTIAKTIKGQQALALELYATGIMDAMYLAGMVADGGRMTRPQLQSWAKGAVGMPMIAEYTVPWVTVENADGAALATEWMRAKEEQMACSGWCTYTGLVATKSDEALDLKEIEGLLGTVVKDIGGAKNRVRLTMNGFVIAVGRYVTPLAAKGMATARKLGVVEVDMADTACKISLATEAIEKAQAAGKLGVKKKTIRC
jgi:3-methyladenine DNA glycosylase AlkD